MVRPVLIESYWMLKCIIVSRYFCRARSAYILEILWPRQSYHVKFTSEARLKIQQRVKHNNYELQIRFSGYSMVFPDVSERNDAISLLGSTTRHQGKQRNKKQSKKKMFIKTKRNWKQHWRIKSQWKPSLSPHLQYCELCMVDYNFNVVSRAASGAREKQRSETIWAGP